MTTAGRFACARRVAVSLGIILALGATLTGPIDSAAAQNARAKRTPAQGAGSTQAVTAQMKNAIALTRGGRIDAGAVQLNAALDAADRLDDAQFVMEQYYDATAALRAVKRDDLAEKLFVRAFQSKAAAQSPPGNADVLLEYAILLSDHARIAEAVPLYMKGIAAFNAYWGEGSEESLIANDKLAVALSANGSAASATNLGRHNFEAMLKDKTTLYVVPDGFLFAVPFSLLPDADGGLLEDKFAIRMLTSPDALIAIHARETLDKQGAMLLAGGIEYGVPGPMQLPATRTEIEAIAKLARARGAPVEMLSGRGVSEGVLREAIGKARIAHLATHGFYHDSTASGLDTLWQSGIVLSGAGDSRWPLRDDKDGYLYAFELMDWDLSGLDLLVLSACETGRGDESFVSGLRGLPTALGIAGARRALLTLWPVADEGTANFALRFYEHLAEGLTYSDALRQTRRDARDGKVAGARDASVWAAFVLFEG